MNSSSTRPSSTMHVHHRVQQRDVGVGLELQVVRGVARELRAARIGEDQLGAVLHRVLDPRRGDRMVDDRIGADQQDDLGVQHVASPGWTPRPSRCLRAAPRRSTRGTGACSGRRCWCRKPVRTSFWNRYASSLLPLAEPKPASACGPCVSRICAACRRRGRAPLPRSLRGRRVSTSFGSIVKSADFGAPAPADQRLGQALRVMHVVEAVAALDAQPALRWPGRRGPRRAGSCCP